MKTYHRVDLYGAIHACTYYQCEGTFVKTDCGLPVPANLSREIEDSTVTCPQCLALWTPWAGGEPPIAPDKPVQMWWANGIQRIYERGDWINWKNLPADGSVRWRRPL